jgi:hypothetical protein
LAITALCACAAALIAAAPGGADRPAPHVDLGLEPRPPAPVCPSNCRVITRVTGFQTLAENGEGERKNLPLRVPFDGVLTSWTISLAFPTNQQRAFFNRGWGSPAKARIGVLRRVPDTQPPRYRLIRQTPPRSLTGWFGRTPRFPVRPAIPVRRGQIIALTVPTWAPALAIDIPKRNRWRASRNRGRCLEPADLRRGRPHQVRGGRVYGCLYERARLLYSVRIARR